MPNDYKVYHWRQKNVTVRMTKNDDFNPDFGTYGIPEMNP